MTWHAVGGCGSNFGCNNTSLHGLHLPVVIQTVKTPAGLSQGRHFYLKGSLLIISSTEIWLFKHSTCTESQRRSRRFTKSDNDKSKLSKLWQYFGVDTAFINCQAFKISPDNSLHIWTWWISTILLFTLLSESLDKEDFFFPKHISVPWHLR